MMTERPFARWNILGRRSFFKGWIHSLAGLTLVKLLPWPHQVAEAASSKPEAGSRASMASPTRLIQLGDPPALPGWQ